MRLSEQLSALSVRAKNAEDAAEAARHEAHDAIMARREQTRAAVSEAIKKVDQDIKSASGSAAGHWNALKAKLAADTETLKSAIETRRHERGVKRAEGHAELLEWEAACAVDYAIAAIEQAKLAVLDAIAGRAEAEEAKKH